MNGMVYQGVGAGCDDYSGHRGGNGVGLGVNIVALLVTVVGCVVIMVLCPSNIIFLLFSGVPVPACSGNLHLHMAVVALMIINL